MGSPAASSSPTVAGPRAAEVERYLQVVRFGRQEPLEVDVSDVLTFPQGLVGMDDLRRFVVIEDPRTFPCRWLQSLDDPALAFVVVDPHLIQADYVAQMSGEDALQLRLDDPRDADVWAIVTVQPELERSTVNLLAPVVVNRRTQLGKQIILHETAYALRHPLVGGAHGARAAGAAGPGR